MLVVERQDPPCSPLRDVRPRRAITNCHWAARLKSFSDDVTKVFSEGGEDEEIVLSEHRGHLRLLDCTVVHCMDVRRQRGDQRPATLPMSLVVYRAVDIHLHITA